MTRRVCTFERVDDDGHPIGRCVLEPDHEGTVHRDAFGFEWDVAEIEEEAGAGGARRVIEEWAPEQERHLPRSPKAVLKRMRALGLDVRVTTATVEVDAKRWVGTTDDHEAGSIRKPYHHVVSYGLLATAEDRHIAAFWDHEQTEKGRPVFGDARWIVDGQMGWTKTAGALTALLDRMEEAA